MAKRKVWSDEGGDSIEARVSMSPISNVPVLHVVAWANDRPSAFMYMDGIWYQGGLYAFWGDPFLVHVQTHLNRWLAEAIEFYKGVINEPD